MLFPGIKIPIIFTLLILSVCPMLAQQKLDTLLVERKELYKNYEELQEIKSGFLGMQSKDDLKNIIETLDAIISKDNEIVREIYRTHQEETMTFKKEQTLEHTDLSLRERDLVD